MKICGQEEVSSNICLNKELSSGDVYKLDRSRKERLRGPVHIGVHVLPDIVTYYYLVTTEIADASKRRDINLVTNTSMPYTDKLANMPVIRCPKACFDPGEDK